LRNKLTLFFSVFSKGNVQKSELLDIYMGILENLLLPLLEVFSPLVAISDDKTVSV